MRRESGKNMMAVLPDGFGDYEDFLTDCEAPEGYIGWTDPDCDDGSHGGGDICAENGWYSDTSSGRVA